MTKSELIERIAQAQFHLVERDVALAVNMMLDHIATCLSGGGRIEIRGSAASRYVSAVHASAAIPGPERRYRFRRDTPLTSNRERSCAHA